MHITLITCYINKDVSLPFSKYTLVSWQRCMPQPVPAPWPCAHFPAFPSRHQAALLQLADGIDSDKNNRFVPLLRSW